MFFKKSKKSIMYLKKMCSSYLIAGDDRSVVREVKTFEVIVQDPKLLDYYIINQMVFKVVVVVHLIGYFLSLIHI